MTYIKNIKINVEGSIEPYIEDIVKTVEGLNFDWCKMPVEIIIQSPSVGEGQTWIPTFDIVVRNEGGYFGFSI